MSDRENRENVERIARQITELCPRAPGELLRALQWLYRHPDLGEYLCGRGAGEGAAPLEALRQEGPPEYLALAAYRLLLDAKNSK